MTEESNTNKVQKVKSLNILVVEDNEINRLLASMVLGNIGHHVFFAHNGKECIQLLTQHNYDCIFMDIHMPVMDGLATTEFIRNTLKSNVPIIGLSANDYAEDIEKSLLAGMNDHIEKMYTENSITLVIDKWVK